MSGHEFTPLCDKSTPMTIAYEYFLYGSISWFWTIYKKWIKRWANNFDEGWKVGWNVGNVTTANMHSQEFMYHYA